MLCDVITQFNILKQNVLEYGIFALLSLKIQYSIYTPPEAMLRKMKCLGQTANAEG